VEISEIFSTYFQTNLLQDPIVTHVQKIFFFLNMVLVLEMTVLEHFWWKHSHNPSRVKYYFLYPKMIFLLDKMCRINPSPPKGMCPHIVWQSNSKCFNFCIQCLNSIKLVGKVVHTSLVFVVKFLDWCKMYWFFESHLKFTSSIQVHLIALWWLQLWGLVSFSSNVCCQYNLLGFVPLKVSLLW